VLISIRTFKGNLEVPYIEEPFYLKRVVKLLVCCFDVFVVLVLVLRIVWSSGI